jgi:hypothetical protein
MILPKASVADGINPRSAQAKMTLNSTGTARRT